jgi:hypothetical protein
LIPHCWVDFQILGYVAKKNGVEIDQQDLRAPLPGTRHRRAGGRQITVAFELWFPKGFIL